MDYKYIISVTSERENLGTNSASFPRESALEIVNWKKLTTVCYSEQKEVYDHAMSLLKQYVPVEWDDKKQVYFIPLDSSLIIADKAFNFYKELIYSIESILEVGKHSLLNNDLVHVSHKLWDVENEIRPSDEILIYDGYDYFPIVYFYEELFSRYVVEAEESNLYQLFVNGVFCHSI